MSELEVHSSYVILSSLSTIAPNKNTRKCRALNNLSSLCSSKARKFRGTRLNIKFRADKQDELRLVKSTGHVCMLCIKLKFSVTVLLTFGLMKVGTFGNLRHKAAVSFFCFLISIKSRDFWAGPTREVRHSQTFCQI